MWMGHVGERSKLCKEATALNIYKLVSVTGQNSEFSSSTSLVLARLQEWDRN